MIILLLADTHDLHDHIRRAFDQARKITTLDAIFHAGDLAAPETFDVLMEANLPIHYVIGNNEDDPDLIAEAATRHGIHFYGEQAEFTLGNRQIAMTHYPRIAESLATFGRYDLILFGHSHNALKRQLTHGGYLVNPGNLAGWREAATFALYDTQNHAVQHHVLQTRQTSWSFS
ncbi:hypothetical protein COW46_03270 [Candidatus Gracilibacteria bacterium CG17_big_fil_post_rev_8_21_14_2_50_48_13]|nr:MAG: hypothetical protein COW46_03270 [Candidatus Gracilibacteria bacterium CG17_big_fil_post_rev_8_21_14_2_50_48_13]